MSDFIYSDRGEVQGFRIGHYLYDMRGRAVGRVSAERVYRLDGLYVGEMFRNMVLEKPVGARRNLPPVARPRDVTPPSLDSGIGADSQGFPDVFHRLLDALPDGEPPSPPESRPSRRS
jgi:hypothetical protein